MKKLASILLFIAATCGSSAYATVSLQFGVLEEGRATGFSNHLGGTGTNGMRWGIIVSTTNAGFSGATVGTTYDAFNINTSGFLTVGGVLTDDYYVAHPTSALTSTSSPTSDDPGGAGGILTINPVPYGGLTNITSSDPFQIVWFETNATAGSYYGMMGNGLFVIPSDTGVVSFASAPNNVFGGPTADPIKPANLQIASAVPEPSHSILAFLGLSAAVFSRRRRA